MRDGFNCNPLGPVLGPFRVIWDNLVTAFGVTLTVDVKAGTFAKIISLRRKSDAGTTNEHAQQLKQVQFLQCLLMN